MKRKRIRVVLISVFDGTGFCIKINETRICIVFGFNQTVK